MRRALAYTGGRTAPISASSVKKAVNPKPFEALVDLWKEE